MSDTGGQHKRQYDWLKQYQFQKGQSGNPSGGPKGKTLKTFAREMFEAMSDEDKAKFLKRLDPDLIWRMSEGNPHQTEDITSDGKALPTPIYGGQSIPIQGHHSDQKDIQPAKEN